MSNHPVNLAVRFLLEIAALLALGVWSWGITGVTWLRILLTLAIPLAAAAVWGIFRVPNDPGPAPVPVPGWLRLSIELAFFAAAVIALLAAGWTIPALILAVVVIAHYALSRDRITRMLRVD